ncbi:MAG: 3-deoxy-manno-octulosonate cytidylyltransferase [Marinilabiliales bacterium]|nr:MAG: 3-deoxy-manno-octulosonate cytidylyltransferase [Marinilabiliales bacterium]
MNIIGIIPARYQSSRFPGKPLAKIGNKTMIQMVYEQASKAKKLCKIVVATDDARIAETVNQFNGEVILTRKDHLNGTSRCFEVFEQYDSENPDFYTGIVNIQGDEPFINPSQIDQLCDLLTSKGAPIATLAKEINSSQDLFDPNTVKLVFNNDKEVLYFSRNPLPYARNIEQSKWLENHQYYKHIGIYGFNSTTFNEINKLKLSPLEAMESLEQLRWLENGNKIIVDITDIESFGIDTPEDLEKLINNI